MKITAYAWATGLIEFGLECPKGALPVATGEEEHVRRAVEVIARHGYQDELLVPGVPEAEDPDQQVDALLAFAERVREAMLLEAA